VVFGVDIVEAVILFREEKSYFFGGRVFVVEAELE